MPRDGDSTQDAAALQWYAVQCKRHEDERALANLERQHYVCFLPRLRVERLRRGRRIAVLEPLFPHYLFIRLNPSGDNWHRVRSTRGVSHLVQFNDKLVPVRDEIIGRIRTRLINASPQVPVLQPGERVRIAEGAFSELEAIFVANDGIERVVLLLNILQKDQELCFPITSIRKVE